MRQITHVHDLRLHTSLFSRRFRSRTVSCRESRAGGEPDISDCVDEGAQRAETNHSILQLEDSP
jgi:hypothetical protein